MNKLILTLVSITLTISVFSQNVKFNLPPKNFYKNSKIGLLEFKKFDAINLSINSDSIFFINEYTKAAVKLSIDEVNYLRVQEGNQAGTWALYGGALMGFSCLLAALEVWSYSNLIFRENAGIIAFSLVAGGVAIGALIGSAIPKWKTYYVHKDMGLIDAVNFGFYANTDGAGIKLRFTL